MKFSNVHSNHSNSYFDSTILHLGTVNFNGANGCQKCETTGEFKNRMSFPVLNDSLRTNESFRNRSQAAHHKEYSILEELPINMVDCFPVSDSLHLIEHGVMKKNLLVWLNGKTLSDFKIKKEELKALNQDIYFANKEMCSDIKRSTRSIDYIKYWKATEFRTFLLYIGPILLRDRLPFEIYEHFLLLFCAVRICSCQLYVKIFPLAEKLFLEYVENYILIYGRDHIVSNIHNLIHVFNDVKTLGNLNTISAYKFEDCLGQLKKRVKTCNLPVEQIARRIFEFAQNIEFNIASFDQNKFRPILKYENNSKEFKYILISPNVFLSTKKIGDSFFMTHDKIIVKMNYAKKFNEEFFINGAPFLTQKNFFDLPFSSSFIDIYLSSDQKGNNQFFNINRIKCKMFRLSYKEEFVFMPILHSLDDLNNI